MTSEPPYFGAVPVRTELTVLGPDTPGKPIGWTMTTYSGSEVYLLDENDRPIETPLTKRDDLHAGMRIMAPTLVGGVLAVVREGPLGILYWETEKTMGDLVFGGDDRGAWVTTSAYSKKALNPNE